MNLLVPLSVVSATVVSKVAQHVPRPFIDEVFHLRQCAVFCSHHFASWDPKITTPPGLYLLGTAYAHVLKAAGVSNACGYTSLRFLNVLGGGPVLYAVLSLYPTRNYRRANILSLPLLYTYNFLFYTDVWSTVLVVAALMVVLRWPNAWGSTCGNALGFLSLWFRQTNIVWVLLLSVLLVDLRRPRPQGAVARSQGAAARPQGATARPQGAATAGVCSHLESFVKTALLEWRLLVPFAANAVGFVAFLKWNGGITFGDKENHQLSLHFVQVFYCVLFMACFTAPVWISSEILYEYAGFCGWPGLKECVCVSGSSGQEATGGVTSHMSLPGVSPSGVSPSGVSPSEKSPSRLRFARIIVTTATYAAIAFVVKNYSVVHPFLLADNRHYTFYLYRRVLSKPWSVFLMTPAYHFSTWLVASLLLKTHRFSRPALSPVSIVAFFGAMVATLVPSPLFEPRYFILPLALFRIFIAPADHVAQRHLAEFTWYTSINVIFFIVFFSYEFTWFSEPGVQRIIW